MTEDQIKSLRGIEVDMEGMCRVLPALGSEDMAAFAETLGEIWADVTKLLNEVAPDRKIAPAEYVRDAQEAER